MAADSSMTLLLESLKADQVEALFGCPLITLYKHAIKFYKENERSGAMHLEYSIRLRFMAYSKQVRYGDFKEDVSECGWLDFVGNDARREWKKLAEQALSPQQAMLEFVRLLDAVCPAFRPHIKERVAIEAPPKPTIGEDRVNRLGSLVNGSAEASKETLQRYQQQRQQIQEALNRQTYHQFLAYAQQTHPGEQDKQEQLIAQLQEQHYEQYMSQVYAQQSQAQAASLIQPQQGPSPPPSNSSQFHQIPTTTNGNSESSDDSESGPKPKDAYLQQGLEKPPHRHVRRNRERGGDTVQDDNATEDSDVSDEEEETVGDEEETQPNPKIAPASMWNSKNIVDFKNTIKKEGPEGVLKIGHGETVTVRVPTHEGTHLFWEFATDGYDIGFGLFFEWTIAESNQVTVHISESSDEDYGEGDEEGGGAGDVETGGGKPAEQRVRDPNKPLVDEVIPVYRRDAHIEVFAGSHIYPGRGVYLLKFDNSYSLWRSKHLYYRVFYSR